MELRIFFPIASVTQISEFCVLFRCSSKKKKKPMQCSVNLSFRALKLFFQFKVNGKVY